MTIIDKLDDLGISYKRDTKSDVLIQCPYCNHHNPKLSINTQTGFYRCFICEKKGRASEKDQLWTSLGAGQAPDGPQPTLKSESSSPESIMRGDLPLASTQVPSYLEKRRISQLCANKGHLRYDDTSNALVFPFHNAKGEIVGQQFKALDPESTQRYWIKGESTQLYYPDFALVSGARYVVVVEGQFDALSLSQIGVPAISVCGSSGLKAVNALNSLGKRLYICFDNDLDPATNSQIRKKERELAIAVNGTVISMPEGIKDFNEWLCISAQADKEILNHVSRQIQEASLSVQAKDLISEVNDYVNNQDLVKGLPTGVDSYDRLLGGGKRLGELTVTMAEAKTGKNAFWHYLMHGWLKKGIKIGYASRELTPVTEVIPNLLSIEFGKDYSTASTPNDQTLAGPLLAGWGLYFAKGYGMFPIENIRTWIDELIQEGVQYFWIDHLHYCLEEPEEHKDASKLIKELKTLTKEKNIHIDLIVQPNKMLEGQRMGLQALKGGSAIGQALDNLVVIERVKNNGKPSNVSKITLEVARSRQAQNGFFYMEYTRGASTFQEVEVVPEPTVHAIQRGSDINFEEFELQ